MKRLIFLCAIALSGTAIAESNVAFTAADIDQTLKTKKIEEGSIVEAPMSFDSVIPSLELSKSTTLINREYAGKETWGSLCNITDNLSDPNYADKRSWTINLVNMGTGATEKLFSSTNKRKIQSVACSPFEGDVAVIFSMKESTSGDYEIYQLVTNEESPFIKLTDNDTDDVDVTASWDGSVIAWQKRLADGRQAIQLLSYDWFSGEPKVRSLASASPFVQPSLSRNGNWLTFVQLRPSFFAVMRYDVLNKTYKEVRKVPRRKKLYHPSISDDGNIIGWSENRSQNRYLVKNLSENTVTEVVNSQWGVEHGYLSAGGDMLVYSINNDGNGKYQTLITDLETMTTSRVGDLESAPSRYLATSWMGSSIQPAGVSDFSGQVYVNPDELLPVVLTFDTSGYGQEFTNPYEYAYSGDYASGFQWQVNGDGNLVLDYDSVTDPYEDETGSVIASINYQQGNLYNIHAVGSEQGESLIADFLKLKPLSIADLDGKVIKESYQCPITYKFDGNTVTSKEFCGYSGLEIKSYTLSEHASLANVLIMKETEVDPWSETGELEETYYGLVDGEIANGDVLRLVTIKQPNQSPAGVVRLLDFSLSDQEVSPVNHGSLRLGVYDQYEVSQSSSKATNKIILDTEDTVHSFAMDFLVDGHNVSSRIETDIRMIYRPVGAPEGDLTNAVFASMMLMDKLEEDVVMTPFIGRCLNADCSSEKWVYVPNVPDTKIRWYGDTSDLKLTVAFNESTQVFTFKLNNQSFKMGLEYFYSELGLPNTELRSEDAYGEIRATTRNVSSRGDWAYIDLMVGAAYVNGELYDDFEIKGVVESGKWDTSEIH